jgi:isopenicillin N synthase-like dioxygenase
MNNIPIIDIGSYIDATADPQEFARQMRSICTNIGFFYISNHHVPLDLQEALLESTRRFFALPREEKNKIHMKLGGRAWRGFFELGEEYTSGKIDLK